MATKAGSNGAVSETAAWLAGVPAALKRLEEAAAELAAYLDLSHGLAAADVVEPMLALRAELGVSAPDRDEYRRVADRYAQRLTATVAQVEARVASLLYRTEVALRALAAQGRHPRLLQVAGEVASLVAPLQSGLQVLVPEDLPPGHPDRERLCRLLPPGERLQTPRRGGLAGALVLGWKDVPDFVDLDSVRGLTEEYRMIQRQKEESLRARAAR